MSKGKKSIFGSLFGGSKNCSCGVEIVDEKEDAKTEKDTKKEEK